MNYYSGFLLGLLLICSGLFYGLALTNNNKKYQSTSSVLDGTWRLVTTRILTEDGKLLSEKDETQLQAIKIVANQHFTVLSKTTDGQLLQAAAGTFELAPDRYSESVQLAVVAADQKQYHYQWRLDHGLWYQRSEVQQQVVEQVWQLVESI